jgi:lipopolysaccharide transport system ATP-binding protein
MNNTVIKVEHLSKKYLLTHQQQERYSTIREVMVNSAKQVGKNLFSYLNFKHLNNTCFREEFYALKDVSFEVEEGDCVGIIGHNGAGKSTLLKILSRITDPSNGRVEITGSLANLLEVGTGFHPELTGRENIFLNGAILGMRKTEIIRKFDEIVAFAEVERFLDTPVKRYSSGMYVRLAFAVAAHLEPDILLVDEVLAVGDAQFQKKCLLKMESVGKEGRTILFVSHNMAALQALCTKAIRLKSGEIVGQGDVNNQIEMYIKSLDKRTDISPNNPIRLGSNLILRSMKLTPSILESGQKLRFSFELFSNKPDHIDSVVILIFKLGLRVAILDLRRFGFPVQLKYNSRLQVNGEIKSLPLVDGDYSIGLYIESNELREKYLDLINITITSKIYESKLIPFPSNVRGIVEIDYDCEIV